MKPGRNFVKILVRALPLCLLSVILVLSGLCGTAGAERSLSMKQVDIHAEVLPDASMQVRENLTIDFSGQWNGFFVNIPKDYTEITQVQVSEGGKPYEINNGTEYGPPGTFMVKDQGDSLLIDWSIDAQDETRTFTLSYRVINAVLIHKDVAELNRKFIGEANQLSIGKASVKLKLPPGSKKYQQGTDIRIWGHGPLEGEVSFSGPNTVIWQSNHVPPETFIEGRVVMPLALFPNAPDEAKTNRSALSTILAEEENWAEQANRRRWIARGEMGGAAAVILASLGSVFLLWRKYGRSHPVTFDGEYYRELPGDYSPGELSTLWNFKSVKPQDLTATILDLARRKFLRIDQVVVEKDRFLLGPKKEEAYRLTFLPAPEPGALRKPEEAALRPHEQELLTYLSDTVAGGRGYLYLHEIEEYAKDHSEGFYQFWQDWTEGLNLKGEELNFFESGGSMVAKIVIAGILMFILAALLLSRLPILGFALIAGGFIVILVPLFFKRRSPSGQEDYVKWKAFRKFLLDFSQMESYEIPSLVIWEHYLVYAVTLGVAKEVIKQLELVFPNMQEGDYRFGYGWYYFGPDLHFAAFNNSLDFISESIDQAVNTAQAAVAKSSSGSGGGGGFSGGSGGGSGGGSYGGR